MTYNIHKNSGHIIKIHRVLKDCFVKLHLFFLLEMVACIALLSDNSQNDSGVTPNILGYHALEYHAMPEIKPGSPACEACSQLQF